MPTVTLPLSASDRRGFLDIFEHTFGHEPSFEHLFPHAPKRRAQTRWVGDCKLNLLSSAYRMELEKEGNQVTGFCAWLAPPLPHITLGQQLKAGFVRAPVVAGLTSLRRMMAFSNNEHSLLEEHGSRAGRWVLDVIAVHPDHQRKGLGQRLTEPVLSKLKTQGKEAFVVTHNPRNLAFYRRLGFELILERQVPNAPVTSYGLLFR